MQASKMLCKGCQKQLGRPRCNQDCLDIAKCLDKWLLGSPLQTMAGTDSSLTETFQELRKCLEVD